MSWGSGFFKSIRIKLQALPVILVILVLLTYLNPVQRYEAETKSQPRLQNSSTLSPLVKSSTSPTIYIVNGSQKHQFINQDVINDYSILGPIRTVDQTYLNGLADGPGLGRVVGSTQDSNIYLLISGIKLLFSSCGLLEDYGFSCDNNVELTPEVLSRFVTGPSVTPFIKSVADSTVYFVQDGKKRPVASWPDLVGLGFPIAINWLNDAFVNSVPTGDLILSGGGLVKTSSSASVYAVNNWSTPPSLFPVTSFGVSLDLGLGTNVRTLTNSEFSKYTVGTNLRSTVKCGSNFYSGANGVLYRIDPSLFTHFGLTQSNFLESGEICDRFTFSQTPMSRFILNNGTIYYVENGAKRGFTSYRAYLENGGNTAPTIPVSDSFASRLTNGAPIVATTPRGEAEIANDIYIRVNTERAARGLHPLGWDDYLNNNARNWSIQMANSNSFAHSNIYPLLDRFNVAAENIGLAGPGSRSSALHVAWMNSTGHRVNLLARNLDVIGIGVYCAPDGRLWVTQQFGRWPNSGLPTTFGPIPSVAPIVANDGGGPTC